MEGATDFDRYVVVDVETTGLYNKDRIVEVAAVTMDRQGRVIDEWDTLVDPGRDVGPTWIHGVNASMVANAPAFEDIGHSLADRLDGAVLVAHNLDFDARFLRLEYERVGGTLDSGFGVCTMRRFGGRLPDLCASVGVEMSDHHRALTDARATAYCLVRLIGRVDERRMSTASVHHYLPARSRTHRRDALGTATTRAKPPYLGYLALRLTHGTVDSRVLPYVDLLDWALADLAIDDTERSELRWLAQSLGLDEADQARAHSDYLTELVGAALKDGVVTEDERDQLRRAAEALQVELDESLLGSLESSKVDCEVVTGMRICFTGDAVHKTYGHLTRSLLHAMASEHGFTPVHTVSKRGCDILVAADPLTQSGKAANARKWGIPVISVSEFVDRFVGSSPC